MTNLKFKQHNRFEDDEYRPDKKTKARDWDRRAKRQEKNILRSRHLDANELEDYYDAHA